MAVVLSIGATASIFDVPEMWAAYSVAQGSQGLLIAMLVSCNCKILKLYAQPRGNKKRSANYSNLSTGEGGRYGVLSVTNPNYENFTTISPAIESMDLENQSFVKMTYKEDNFVERNETLLQKDPGADRIIGDLSSALNVKELVKGPAPMSV